METNEVFVRSHLPSGEMTHETERSRLSSGLHGSDRPASAGGTCRPRSNSDGLGHPREAFGPTESPCSPPKGIDRPSSAGAIGPWGLQPLRASAGVGGSMGIPVALDCLPGGLAGDSLDGAEQLPAGSLSSLPGDLVSGNRSSTASSYCTSGPTSPASAASSVAVTTVERKVVVREAEEPVRVKTIESCAPDVEQVSRTEERSQEVTGQRPFRPIIEGPLFKLADGITGSRRRLLAQSKWRQRHVRVDGPRGVMEYWDRNEAKRDGRLPKRAFALHNLLSARQPQGGDSRELELTWRSASGKHKVIQVRVPEWSNFELWHAAITQELAGNARLPVDVS
mmetsp:Transcript_124417/g.277494  ORF Transcript_124417/g.277494 Transcript_124417/m.277494 type:complete len:338 (+) Transcript_124417:94-1107(+)